MPNKRSQCGLLCYSLFYSGFHFSLGLPLLILSSDIWKWSRMPKGPLPIPFVGNRLPEGKPWLKFEEWSKIYGPIFTIWIGRTPTLIISDPIVAAELMEKRSNKCSSGPRFVAMGELLWQMASVLVQPYGKEWSIRRKLLHHALTPAALRTYKQRQEAEASRLVFHILERPEDYEKSIERFTASVVFSIAYGHRIYSLNSTVILERYQFMQYSASLNVPGKYAVENFPILKYMPTFLAHRKRVILEHGRREAEENMALVEEVKSDILEAKFKGEGVAASLTRDLLKMRREEEIPLSDRDLSFVSASLFGAGADATASTMCSAILAFVTHPEALRLAQKELDTIVGLERSPIFADEPNLPYMRALVKEVLRWRPVAVLGGTPHSSTEDDDYEGYRIPKGTSVLGNSWAINLNEEFYPNPHLFSPGRFLDQDV